jgi:hypothetical protein
MIDQASGIDSPGLVIKRIGDILRDLDERQNPFEEAVGQLERLEAKWEFRYLTTLQTTEGGSAEKRKAQAYTATVAAHAEFYGELIETRAEVKATRAVIGLLEAQLSALQSVLRAQSREAGQSQPSWSSR